MGRKILEQRLGVRDTCAVIMSESNPGKKPRTFKWSQTARDIVRANLDVKGPELRDLVTRMVELTGNPRDACLRFARQLGLKAKRTYRYWSPTEKEKLEDLLDVHKVRGTAILLRRSPDQLYSMMHRLGISGKSGSSLSVYKVAEYLHKRAATVRKWINCGALEAPNEGTEKVPRYMITFDALRRFHRKHGGLIDASRVDRRRLKFLLEDVFPSLAKEHLSTRKNKKEQRAYEKQREEEALDEQRVLFDQDDRGNQ